jgi:8-oxo-dGTP pyrophosphatase MutT (NUDIX family)
MTANIIRIVVLLYMDSEGKVLLVRKRGTAMFMLPGGKPDEGESELACLEREIYEELNSRIEPESLRRIGTFTDKAANEPDTQVEAVVFEGRLTNQAVPSAEIEEVLWHFPMNEHSNIAPLVRNQILPLLTTGRSGHGSAMPLR